MLEMTGPTLLLDEDRCRNNIRRMADRVARSESVFRPHFKTHQSLEIGEWFKAHGVDAITVSSVKMAQYFSPQWKDITIAIPFNIHEVGDVNDMPWDCHVNLLVMHPKTVMELEAGLTRNVGVYIKIDIGYGRTGLLEDDPELDRLLDLLEAASKMTFRGFLGHAGHTYYASSKQAIRMIDLETRAVMQRLNIRFKGRVPGLETSLGDTPSCSVAGDLSGISEWRPGNFVFYDLKQASIGSCETSDIAVAMACPVIAKHPDRLIIHGGAAHFARDFLPGEDGQTVFGQAVETRDRGWGEPIEGLQLTALSQEHGTMTGPAVALERFDVGDFVHLLPVHSCMTAIAMKRYRTLAGETIRHLESG